MKTASKFYKRLNYTLALALFSAAMLSTATSQTAPSASSKTQLMFVQSAEDLKVDVAKSTFRLVKVNQQTLYFSDRPERIAGHMKMDQYLTEWSKAEGPDNFSSDPPNAILSVFEPGQPDNTVVVVKISHPVVDGSDIVYSYKIIKGQIPSKGGATALFIDSIGVGGGVGAGYHGVGVGGRGAGAR
jgi:hypothetical protein